MSNVELTLRGKYISMPRIPTSLGRGYSETEGVEMGATIVCVGLVCFLVCIGKVGGGDK